MAVDKWLNAAASFGNITLDTVLQRKEQLFGRCGRDMMEYGSL